MGTIRGPKARARARRKAKAYAARCKAANAAYDAEHGGAKVTPRRAEPEPIRWDSLLAAEPMPDGLAWAISFRSNGVVLGEAVMDVDGEVRFWPDRQKDGSWPAHVLRAVADFCDSKSIQIGPDCIQAPWE
jgi:hypothetical protein